MWIYRMFNSGGKPLYFEYKHMQSQLKKTRGNVASPNRIVHELQKIRPLILVTIKIAVTTVAVGISNAL